MTARTRHRILVVDDSATARIFAAQTLEDAGFVVETIDNAWMSQKVSEFKPDLVLVDVNLGKTTLDGAVSVSALRRTRFADRTRFALYSTLSEERLSELSQSCGADGFVPKAKDAAAFVGKVRSLLGQPPMGRRGDRKREDDGRKTSA